MLSIWSGPKFCTVGTVMVMWGDFIKQVLTKDRVFLRTCSTRRNCCLALSCIYTYFNTLKKKSLRKTLWKNVKLLKMSNFTFFHNVFYAICILKSFYSHISVVVCSFFEFGKVSKWCIREWVKERRGKKKPMDLERSTLHEHAIDETRLSIRVSWYVFDCSCL